MRRHALESAVTRRSCVVTLRLCYCVGARSHGRYRDPGRLDRSRPARNGGTKTGIGRNEVATETAGHGEADTSRHRRYHRAHHNIAVPAHLISPHLTASHRLSAAAPSRPGRRLRSPSPPAEVTSPRASAAVVPSAERRVYSRVISQKSGESISMACPVTSGRSELQPSCSSEKYTRRDRRG